MPKAKVTLTPVAPVRRGPQCLILGLALYLAGALAGCQTGFGGEENAKPEKMIAQADRAFELGTFADAVEIYKLASVAARGEKDDVHFVEAAAQVASAYSLMGQSEQGDTWFREARELGAKPSESGYGRLLLAEGLRLREVGDLSSAANRFQNLFDWSMDQQRFGWALQASAFGSVVAESSQRVAWCERGLEAAQASGERTWMSAAYQSLGFAHEEQGDFETAVIELRKARDLAQSGSRERLRVNWALAHNMRLAGDLQGASQLLKVLIPKARALHSRGFASRDAEWLGRCHEEWGELLASRAQWSAALRALNSARQAYQLAQIQDLAPAKWEALEARIAQIRMAKVKGE